MVRSILHVVLVVAVVGIVPEVSGARAISHFLAPVPISPAAIAADPALANCQTWDLRIVVAGGEWGFSALQAELSQGTFYNSPLGGNVPQPQLWGVFPQLRNDTFVTRAANPDDDSTFGAPNIIGGFPVGTTPVEFSATRISVAWVTPSNPGPGDGTYTIARLTWTNDAVGTIIGHTFDRVPQSLVPFAFAVPIPEPVSVVVLVSLVLICRRGRALR